MIQKFGTIWLALAAFAAALMLSGGMPTLCFAQDPFSGKQQQPTFGQSIKNSFNKMGEAISPSKPKEEAFSEDDPTSLKSGGKPSPDLFVSVAHFFEESNKPAEAEQKYLQALKESPNHLVALLSYARFLENQGRSEEAVVQYQKAIKNHPKNASAYNNLGLCFARKKRLKDAVAAMGQAVQLEPRNPLYRNNISAVLVELNRLPDAFAHLRDVHGDAKAYYNLGYLLSKKGDKAAAEHHFKQALRADPSMEDAQRWLAYLKSKSEGGTIDGNYKIIRPEVPTVQPSQQERLAERPMPAHTNNRPLTIQNNNFGASRTQQRELPRAQQQIPREQPQEIPQVQEQEEPEPSFSQDAPLPPDSYIQRLPPVSNRQQNHPTPSWTRENASPELAPLPPSMGR